MIYWVAKFCSFIKSSLFI